MRSSSSSCRWQAPVFFTVSVLLAILAISAALHSLPNVKDELPPTKPITALSLNASKALRKSGFNIMATLLQISPEIFLSPSNSTIFAIDDSAISNITCLPPWLSNHLLQYHSFSVKVSMDDLLKKHQGSCFPTRLSQKNVALTKVDSRKRLVEINHVLVSHPDIFLEGPLSIHGVLGPFSSVDPQGVHLGWDSIPSPICDSNYTLISDVNEAKNIIPWSRIISVLSAQNFVSFAIGLHSVLHGILVDHMNLRSVTIFAPSEFSFVASSPSPLLARIVRFHIVPQRFTSKELSALPDNATLRTLVLDQELKAAESVDLKQGLTINGVKIVAPDIFSSKNIVIHGISRAFQMGDLPNSSR